MGNQLVKFNNLGCTTPNGEVLFSKFSLIITKGNSVLISGPSGCGKSSALRLLSNIWKISQGTVVKPENIGYLGIFYLPQKSYLFMGNLRDQITYPSLSFEEFEIVNDTSDEEMMKLLRYVNLEYIVDRYGGFESEHNWSDVLSLGEQQRLAMARLFFHKPAFAILDEATSAVDGKYKALLFTRSFSY